MSPPPLNVSHDDLSPGLHPAPVKSPDETMDYSWLTSKPLSDQNTLFFNPTLPRRLRP